MAKSNRQEILVMALFVVTKDSVLACANELGVPEEQITDDVMALVREKISQVLGDWRDVVRSMVKETIEKETVKCPLGIVCSPSCAFRQAGECALSRAELGNS
jgi:hypothetical protein